MRKKNRSVGLLFTRPKLRPTIFSWPSFHSAIGLPIRSQDQSWTGLLTKNHKSKQKTDFFFASKLLNAHFLFPCSILNLCLTCLWDLHRRYCFELECCMNFDEAFGLVLVWLDNRKSPRLENISRDYCWSICKHMGIQCLVGSIRFGRLTKHFVEAFHLLYRLCVLMITMRFHQNSSSFSYSFRHWPNQKRKWFCLLLPPNAFENPKSKERFQKQHSERTTYPVVK